MHGNINVVSQCDDVTFSRMFAQVSNWGRWGKDDQRGTYNLITPEKRRQAAALVKSGISVSLEHTVIEGNKFVWESVHGGAFLSHIDAGCHMAYKGRLYNGFTKEEVDTEEGCQKLAVDIYKDGFVTRGILIDMARFKGVPWLEPGTLPGVRAPRSMSQRHFEFSGR